MLAHAISSTSAAHGEQDAQAVSVVFFHDANADTSGNDLDDLLGQSGFDARHPLRRYATVIHKPQPQQIGESSRQLVRVKLRDEAAR